MSELADLEGRLRRLEDEREIGQLLAAYGSSLDYGDVEGFVRCFTADGVLELSRPRSAKVAIRAVGERELRAFAESHSRSPERWHKHIVAGSIITVDQDRGCVSSYYVLLEEDRGRPVVRSFGRYLDRLVRDRSAGWRLSRRKAEVEAAVPDMAPLLAPRSAGEIDIGDD